MWDLESAREDYNRTVPDCERCKFRNGLILGYGSPLVNIILGKEKIRKRRCNYVRPRICKRISK